MDPIEVLEKRIAALELQILPQDKTVEVENGQLVTDLLLQTHSMTSTALSCREVIISILQRLELINDYLNPNYCENQMAVEEKRQYVLELYPELKKNLQLVAEFSRLRSFLDSSSIKNIPSLVDKLQKLTISNVDTYQDCRDVTDRILHTLQQYSEITTSIKSLFVQLELCMSNIEVSLQPKPVPDS